MTWRAGILKKNGDSEGQNFTTKAECEEWVLSKADDIKRSLIVNKENISEREITNW